VSIRNLDALFDPDSIAVIGASMRIGSIGAAIWKQLANGTYPGKLYAVNPKYRELDGHPVAGSAADLHCAPTLAVICTPPATVPRLISELAGIGTRAAVILTTGMSSLQKLAMLKAAQGHLLRLLGPGSIGMLAPHQGLNASYSPVDAIPGELAFVSQSAGLMTTMLDWAKGRRIGFSHCVSLGDQADIDFGDMLDYLASDPKTRAILLYAESIVSPRKFMSAARAAARNKPVIIVKTGRAQPGEPAAPSHTSALTGSDMAFEAAISRAGMLRVNTLQELLLAAETLSRFRTNTDDAITVLTNDSGAGFIATDAAAYAGIRLSEIGTATGQQLAAVLPPSQSRSNPLNLLDDAPVARYEQSLKTLLQAPDTGAVLFIHAPTAAVPSAEIARALAPLAQHEPGCPPRLLACWLGDQTAGQARQTFHDAGIANFDTPEQAIRAFSMLTRYRHNQAELTEAPPALLSDQHPDWATIRSIVVSALASGNEALSQAQTYSLLEACGIARLPAQDPGTRPETALQRWHTQELMVGGRIDRVFGPVILFGQGGRTDEIMADRAVALPPLNVPLVKALVARTRVSRLLAGWGDTPAVDEAALHGVLLAISQLLAEIPEIAELEINPLLVNFEGAWAGDAHIRLSAARPAGAGNFAIRPYPAHLEETVQWQGQNLLLRPIRPEDEALHMEFLQSLAPQDIRMRVFYSRRSMERSELARLVQIDYAREMVFIAVTSAPDGHAQTLGVVRAMTDPDNVSAEFGVIVRSELKGAGLGRLLMHKLIAYLRTQGTARLVATVLDQNDRMLKLAKVLGFEEVPCTNSGEDTHEIVLTLT
jgi:acyl-CoA synthetase (NDP forming)/RimJ/RimL family protein N-acetyltransferase